MKTPEKKDNYINNFKSTTLGYTDVFQKREIWKQIGMENNGTFKISHNSGNELEALKLLIPYKKYEIVMSESDTRPLKFEIDFESNSNYELVLSWEDSMDKLMKRMGLNEVEIGNKTFDDKYFIKSKDAEITSKLLSAEIIEIILRYNVYSLAVTAERKRQKSSLISVISRTVENKDTINELIKLHMLIIDKCLELFIVN